MSAEIISVTNEPMPWLWTRAGAERAVAEAREVGGLITNGLFRQLLDRWRTLGRGRRMGLQTAQDAESLLELQHAIRVSHVGDDILADIEHMAQQAVKWLRNDDTLTASADVPVGARDDDAIALLIREGGDARELVEHPGWPVFMRHVAYRVMAELLALETCAPEEREMRQGTIKRLLQPIRALPEAVRLGMAAKLLADGRSEETGNRRD